MNSLNSSSYDPAAEELDAGDQEPSVGAFDGFLEVLGEAFVSAEPSEGPFDDFIVLATARIPCRFPWLSRTVCR